MNSHMTSFMFGFVTGLGLFATIKRLRKAYLKAGNKWTDDCFLFHPQKYNLKCVKNSSICEQLSCPFCNYMRFVDLIKSTKTHLDICVYLITSEALTKVIFGLFDKGVFVRVVIDKQMSNEANNSKIHVFLKKHIPIKIIDTGDTMHNKFVIIDKEKVVTGSFNWTRQAMQSNFENMVVVHDSQVVKKFLEYFQDIWLTSTKYDH